MLAPFFPVAPSKARLSRKTCAAKDCPDHLLLERHTGFYSKMLRYSLIICKLVRAMLQLRTFAAFIPFLSPCFCFTFRYFLKFFAFSVVELSCWIFCLLLYFPSPHFFAQRMSMVCLRFSVVEWNWKIMIEQMNQFSNATYRSSKCVQSFSPPFRNAPFRVSLLWRRPRPTTQHFARDRLVVANVKAQSPSCGSRKVVKYRLTTSNRNTVLFPPLKLLLPWMFFLFIVYQISIAGSGSAKEWY